MTKQDVFQTLKIESCIDAVGVEWDASEISFPKDLPFLDAKFIETVGAKYLDDKTITTILLSASKRLAQNPAALRLLWHLHYLVVRNYEKTWRTCYKFPELAALGEEARPFYLLLAFSGVHYFGDVHKKLGIPSEALTDAISDFKKSIEGSREKTGHFGLAGHYSGWWQGLFSGRLYRLGRLTFLQETYDVPARVFEHRTTKEIRVLEASGMNPEEVSGSIVGNPISPAGLVTTAPVTLSLTEWREIVRDQDPILGVHISAGDPMETTACIDSFARAIDFHGKYFPGIKFRLFVCDSWLMDPNLAKVAKPDSNIVQFQKRYFLVPSLKNMEFVSIRSIFGAEALERGWENVPHTTSLQKGAAEFKRAGGVLKNGIGIFPWRKWGAPTH